MATKKIESPSECFHFIEDGVIVLHDQNERISAEVEVNVGRFRMYQ
jgi:hypothetical protein